MGVTAMPTTVAAVAIVWLLLLRWCAMTVTGGAVPMPRMSVIVIMVMIGGRHGAMKAQLCLPNKARSAFASGNAAVPRQTAAC